jgi:hypothetical protein
MQFCKIAIKIFMNEEICAAERVDVEQFKDMGNALFTHFAPTLRQRESQARTATAIMCHRGFGV